MGATAIDHVDALVAQEPWLLFDALPGPRRVSVWSVVDRMHRRAPHMTARLREARLVVVPYVAPEEKVPSVAAARACAAAVARGLAVAGDRTVVVIAWGSGTAVDDADAVGRAAAYARHWGVLVPGEGGVAWRLPDGRYVRSDDWDAAARALDGLLAADG